MPAIGFSDASGVTAERVGALIIDEMVDRVDETRREIRSALNGLEALNTRLTRAAAMTQAEADHEFANMDATLQRLLALRQSLQIRVDTLLSQQRIHAASQAAHSQTKVA